jgi:PAS domain-containing protein
MIARGKVYYSDTGRTPRLTGVTWDVTERRQSEDTWDLTERRQAEENLRIATQSLVAEAKFRELLEAAPDEWIGI